MYLASLHVNAIAHRIQSFSGIYIQPCSRSPLFLLPNLSAASIASIYPSELHSFPHVSYPSIRDTEDEMLRAAVGMFKGRVRICHARALDCRARMLCYRAAGATTRCVIVARRDSTTLHALGSAKCNRTNWGTRVLIVNEKGGSHRPQTPRDRGVGRCSHAGGVAHRSGGTHRPFSLRLYPLLPQIVCSHIGGTLAAIKRRNKQCSCRVPCKRALPRDAP